MKEEAATAAAAACRTAGFTARARARMVASGRRARNSIINCRCITCYCRSSLALACVTGSSDGLENDLAARLGSLTRSAEMSHRL